MILYKIAKNLLQRGLGTDLVQLTPMSTVVFLAKPQFWIFLLNSLLSRLTI